jgi:hypothetical protein
MAQWYYAKHDERFGPVQEEELRSLLNSGQVDRHALVWTAGMPEWRRASDLPLLAPELRTEQPVQSQPAQAPISLDPPLAPRAATPISVAAQAASYSGAVQYYTPSGGLPPRAALTLQGHAPPSGDIGDWPLDDLRISQFQSAIKIRKRVTGAANLYRSLFLLSILASVIMFIATLSMYFSGSGRARTEALGFLIFTLATGGFTALYFFAARATMRSQRWATLTMFIIYLASGALVLFSAIISSSNSRSPGGDIFGGLFSMLFVGAFAIVSWRGYAAIPKYLSQPAWCQELIVNAKL